MKNISKSTLFKNLAIMLAFCMMLAALAACSDDSGDSDYDANQSASDGYNGGDSFEDDYYDDDDDDDFRALSFGGPIEKTYSFEP